MPLTIQNWIGALSEGTGVQEIAFRETSGAYDLSWHTAPCRQFIIMTNGAVIPLPPPWHTHCQRPDHVYVKAASD